MSNASKYLSYKYAFSRMKQATEKGFYLEAVMIAESVISDRLHSATGTEDDRRNEHTGTYKYVGLATLIERAKKAGIEPGLLADLDRWRVARNHVAHALARSRPGTPTMPVEDFLLLAETTASDGHSLANRVKRWQQKTKPRRVATKS